MTGKVKKLMWVGDSVVASGFARVTHSVLEHLKSQYEIAVLGVNYTGDPHSYDYPIWPARLGGDLLGMRRLAPLVQTVQPDVIVLFNDVWVIAQYLEVLKDYPGKILAYFPVDGIGYREEWIKALQTVSGVAVYTEFAVDVLREAGLKTPIAVIPHGIDLNVFKPVDRQIARSRLAGLNEDDFIVLNANRNQPRKRIDLTVKGFCLFAETHPDAKLYLHMGLKDVGWDIIPLMQRECSKFGLNTGERLIVTHPNLSPASAVSVEQLNMIYNAANVGLNTSLGEGWGLVSFEHAACKVPQIVTDYAASAEIFQDAAYMLPINQFITAQTINTEGGLVREEDVASALEAVYSNREQAALYAESMYNRLLAPKYNWATIAQQFADEIESL